MRKNTKIKNQPKGKKRKEKKKKRQQKKERRKKKGEKGGRCLNITSTIIQTHTLQIV